MKLVLHFAQSLDHRHGNDVGVTSSIAACDYLTICENLRRYLRFRLNGGEDDETPSIVAFDILTIPENPRRSEQQEVWI